MQAVETSVLTGSEAVCENPLCTVRFAEGGMPQSPKRFCKDACLQQASLLRRVAKLYGLPIETAHEVLTKARGGR